MFSCQDLGPRRAEARRSGEGDPGRGKQGTAERPKPERAAPGADEVPPLEAAKPPEPRPGLEGPGEQPLAKPVRATLTRSIARPSREAPPGSERARLWAQQDRPEGTRGRPYLRSSTSASLSSSRRSNCLVTKLSTAAEAIAAARPGPAAAEVRLPCGFPVVCFSKVQFAEHFISTRICPQNIPEFTTLARNRSARPR